MALVSLGHDLLRCKSPKGAGAPYRPNCPSRTKHVAGPLIAPISLSTNECQNRGFFRWRLNDAPPASAVMSTTRYEPSIAHCWSKGGTGIGKQTTSDWRLYNLSSHATADGGGQSDSRQDYDLYARCHVRVGTRSDQQADERRAGRREGSRREARHDRPRESQTEHRAAPKSRRCLRGEAGRNDCRVPRSRPFTASDGE
ncbi:hypothetical protein BC1002_0136 [Paraburkholderia atlantica]|uniref:Uncharacterized protein n=1 Tax=Paraburkholderia atlantica TaxID=2654982 RepID=D5WA22_PARAM|nr:hypothetical protein BC1002_0136 [Paraburkholderia atlantica]